MTDINTQQQYNIAPPEKKFNIASLLNGPIDVLTILYYLHSKQHTALIDYLVRLLYDLRADEIHAILPQLCHLFVHWSPSHAHLLSILFLHHCAKSLTFTLKVMWILTAELNNLETYHKSDVDKKKRVETLLKDIEITHVNSAIVATAVKSAPATPTQHSRQMSGGTIKLQPGQTINYNFKFVHVLIKPAIQCLSDDLVNVFIIPTTIAPQTAHIVVQPHHVSPPPASANHYKITQTARAQSPATLRPSTSTSPSSPTSDRQSPSSTANEPCHSASPSVTLHHQLTYPAADQDIARREMHQYLTSKCVSPNAAADDALSPANLSPPSLTSHHLTVPTVSHVQSVKEASVGCPESQLFAMLSKQVRSDYFNLELLLFQTLRDISTVLCKLYPNQRNPILRKHMAELNESMIKNLYFPSHSKENRHYKILRVVPEECYALTSRNKAPFLMHVEIAYMPQLSLYGGNLHAAFKSNEELAQDVSSTMSGHGPGLTSPAAQAVEQATVLAGQIQKEANLLPDINTNKTSPHQEKQKSPAISGARYETAYATGVDVIADSDEALITKSSQPTTKSNHTPHNLSVDSIYNKEAVAMSMSRSRSNDELPTQREVAGTATTPPNQPTRNLSLTVTEPPTPHQQAALTSLRQSASVNDLAPRSQTPFPPTRSQSNTVSGSVPQSARRPKRESTLKSSRSLTNTPFHILSNAFGESWNQKKYRIRMLSPYKNDSNWDLLSVIYKAGDDLRQEVLAMQFITQFHRIWENAKLPLFLRPYAVTITSPDSGLIETVVDAVSIDSLKKRIPNFTTLADFYCAYFGGAERMIDERAQQDDAPLIPTIDYPTALRNYVESLAAYSIVCYLLQIKDRHNANIMIDRLGHIIHIDFGFMLSNSPGGNWNFENCPFKLTQEYIDVMGGLNSDLFAYFKMLVVRGFLEARSHAEEFIVLCSIHAADSHMPCFSGPDPNCIQSMRARFALHLTSEDEVEKFVNGLIAESIDNWRSRKYDSYQRLISGIL